MQEAARRIDDRGAEPRYPARVLERPEVTPEGVVHQEAGGSVLLPWSSVRWAIAAEVGEPEGVRTIVFDLLSCRGDQGLELLRLDADPGVDAMDVARAVIQALGPECKVPSVRCLATDGIPARWYPDLGGFEEESLPEFQESA